MAGCQDCIIAYHHSKACKLVKQLGVFDTFAELEFSLTAVLTDWSQ
ncbi:hypothetical protein HaLaN_31554, partial [Haematococcus lacustris]